MQLDEVLSLISSKTGFEPKKSNNGFMACCPAHDDKNPSLSVSETADGTILIKCFAGCYTKDICSAIGIESKDLFPDHLVLQKSNTSKKRKITEYEYKDEQGHTIFKKVRVEPAKDGSAKAFFFSRKDKNNKDIFDCKGCRKLLYHLPEILDGIKKGKPICFVEGEKDADTLMSLGLIATTSPTTSRWEQEFTDILKDADVIILYDYDRTGFKRRDSLSNALHGKVKTLKVVDLPGLEFKESHGEDVSDWLQKGNTIQQLVDIVNKTPFYIPITKVDNNKIRVISMEEFLNLEIPKREMLLYPFLPTQGLALLYAKRGVGKTHVALGISYAVASGGSFLKWNAPIAKKVLYIDGEMPAILMQERLSKILSADIQNKPPAGFLNFITPDLQEEYMPDLSTQEGRDAISKFIEDNDLVIVDNVSTLFRCGVENDAESWAPVQNWALELRRKGKSVLFVHHAGKSGKQRGTSKKEDILDAVIKLEHPMDYKPDQGARFEVHFEKTRNFYGEDAIPFQVQLEEDADGILRWNISNVTVNEEIFSVVQMKNKGKTIAQITEETNLSKSKVETRIKKAKQLGFLS